MIASALASLYLTFTGSQHFFTSNQKPDAGLAYQFALTLRGEGTKAVRFLLIQEMCFFVVAAVLCALFSTQKILGNESISCSVHVTSLSRRGCQVGVPCPSGQVLARSELVSPGQQKLHGRALVCLCLLQCPNQGQGEQFVKLFGKCKV